MRDVNGQFKDSEPVIDAVAEKWSYFDGNTKKAIATAMAGTHQYNKLIAMMDNWNKVQALTETAQNSDGTAEKKFNDNYMNSLEAKTNALKASLENVATSVVSDDMYAGFLDGAKAVADFTAQTDLLKASLVGLGAAGGVYAFGWIQNLIQDFSNLGKAMDILKAGNLTDAGFENLLNLTQGLSASQAKLLASSTALSEAQRVLLLMNTGMSEAEAQAAVAAMGLSADGVAGRQTWEKLREEIIRPRLTEEDMACQCPGYCDGHPNPSTAGIWLLIERIWREAEKKYPGMKMYVSNRSHPAAGGAAATISRGRRLP